MPESLPVRVLGAPVEEIVLGLLQLAQLAHDVGSVPGHGVGMTLGLGVLAPGQRRLRDQSAETGVGGGVGEHGELLVGNRELLTEITQALGGLEEPALDQRPGHRCQV